MFAAYIPDTTVTVRWTAKDSTLTGKRQSGIWTEYKSAETCLGELNRGMYYSDIDSYHGWP